MRLAAHRRREPGLFALLLLVHLAPVASVSYLPTDDSPAHVANAYTLLNYFDPAFASFREYYQIDWRPVPNWMAHSVLAALLKVASPAAAAKWFAALCVVLLPLSARYALGAVRPDARFLAVLSFPFTYNLLFHKGFLNFCLGLPLFFFTLGWWLRHRRPQPLSVAVLALLLLAAYFCHLVVAAATGFVLLVLALTERSSRGAPSLLARLAGLAVAGLPVLALAAVSISDEATQPGYSLSTPARLLQLASCYSLVAFERRELLLSAGVALLFAGAAVLALRRREPNPTARPWSFAVAALVLLYLLVPDRFGSGTHVVERLNLFVYFAALLWLGAHGLPETTRRTMTAAAALLSVGLLASHGAKYRELAPYLEEYLSVATHVAPNSTLLPAVFSYQGETPDGRPLSRRVLPFSNLNGWIVAERGAVDLRNYQGWTGYFPLRFRDPLNPLVGLSATPGGIYLTPPAVDLDGWRKRTGRSVDFVLVWNTRPEAPLPEAGSALFRQLEDAYELAAVSPGRGYARLYRAKPGGPLQPSEAGIPSR